MLIPTHSTGIQRSCLRFSLPSGIAEVDIQLRLIDEVICPALKGRLWDISQQGGCLALVGSHPIALPHGARLQVRDPVSHARQQLDVELRWATAMSHSTFVGMLFVAAPRPQQTFLAAYMRDSWTDAVPSARCSL